MVVFHSYVSSPEGTHYLLYYVPGPGHATNWIPLIRVGCGALQPSVFAPVLRGSESM